MESPIGIKEIVLAPAERAEVIIDFTNLEGKKIVMTNDAPYPFPNGEKVDVNTIGKVMEFRVNLPLSNIDTRVIPSKMVRIPRISEQTAKNRYLSLIERMDSYDCPVMLLDDKDWDAPITENPKLGQTEIWNLINLTSQPHPIHVHLIDFLVLDRRAFDVEKFKTERVIHYTGPFMASEPQERGAKDTVIAYPNQITRIIMNFGPYTGLYVWHCHILEHEDYVMMRPLRVIL